MSDANARFLGTVPEIYDRHLGSVFFEPFAADLARRMPVSPTKPVLEIACGTGILTSRLHEHLSPDVKLVATDLNQPMIDCARGKLGTVSRIEWRQADAAALPFESESFDAVACQFGLMFVPDKAAAFREARRMLAKGGLFAFNVWDSLDHNPLGRVTHATITGFFASDPPNFYEVPFAFHDATVLRGLIEASGFGQVDLQRVTLEVASPSARSLAIGLVRGNPVSLAIEERGVSLDRIVDALEAALAHLGGDNPFRSTMSALVATAQAV
ncbi:MAG: class I SAM-dependent methyltransferase [Burkholderiales bacterium]|nr:class I SAM-dependent methyltransferase [Burkholderiales bacterium]